MNSTAVAPAAPAPVPTADEVIVHSHLLGELAVPAADLLSFPQGLFAFEQHDRYALIPHGRDGLWWLQAVDEAALVFLLADPFHWFPGYEINVPSGDAAQLGIAGPDAMAVFAIVTLPSGEGEMASANLRAPVIVNTATRTGRQLVLPEDKYKVQTPFALA